MQSALLVISLVLLMAGGEVLAQQPDYSSKYSGVDIGAILNSDDKVLNYFECLMDRGGCSEGGADIKRILPEALASQCGRCNERQKAAADKIINFLVTKKPTLWTELEQKYDPAGNYRKNNPTITAP